MAYAKSLVDTRFITREEWKTVYRKMGIGGSDAAAAAGIDPWRSPIALYLDKIGEAPEIEENEAMEWGNRLEPVVAEKFSEVTGLKIQRRNAILHHPEHTWMLANVDRLIIGRNEGLEIKTASEYAKGDWDGDEAPARYILQCMHYMAVTGYQAWWIAVLIGGNKFRYKRIERDEELIQTLIGLEFEFWHHVETRTPPPLDGSSNSADVLTMLYPVSKPNSSIELSPNASALITQYEEASVEEKAAEERKNEAANQLKQLLGDNETGYAGERRVIWKSISSKRLDTKALQVDMPDVYAKYTKTSESRRFSIK